MYITQPQYGHLKAALDKSQTQNTFYGPTFVSMILEGSMQQVFKQGNNIRNVSVVYVVKGVAINWIKTKTVKRAVKC
jgi:hypothetical protein